MKYYKLFTCLFPIKGNNRILLYDIQRGDSYSINLKYHETLLQFKKGININTLKKDDNELLLFLESNNLIFITSEPKSFLDITIEFHQRNLISNLIIDLDLSIKDKLTEKFVQMFDKLLIEAIFLHFNFSDFKEIERIISKFSNSTIRSIEVSFLNENQNITIDFCENLIAKFSRIKRIYIHNSMMDITKKYYSDCFLISRKNEFIGFRGNFNQSKYFFSINNLLFLESQLHHTYFNRKLYIGVNGEIKNAPECEETFGNINDIKNAEELKQIIAKPEFQKYWFVHKELCDVCKDCEFRHMCIDNRLPYQRKDSTWYHKTECNYNPYICKWKGEEGYKTLAECGVINNENGFSIDHEKIAALNIELWEEEEETENA